MVLPLSLTLKMTILPIIFPTKPTLKMRKTGLKSHLQLKFPEWLSEQHNAANFLRL